MLWYGSVLRTANGCSLSTLAPSSQRRSVIDTLLCGAVLASECQRQLPNIIIDHANVVVSICTSAHLIRQGHDPGAGILGHELCMTRVIIGTCQNNFHLLGLHGPDQFLDVLCGWRHAWAWL